MRLQRNATDIVVKQSEIREQEANFRNDQKKVNNLRSRHGIKFMEDPDHDMDYLSISVVPYADELLCQDLQLLPQNLVHQGFLSLQNNNTDEHENDFDGNFDSSVSTKDFQFRSVNHYLNTHFQLNREDCLSQMKRGIAEYRNFLMNMKHNDLSISDIPTPSQDLLRKVTDTLANSKGNNQVYIYVDVVVRDIERTFHGNVLSF
jgi:hypothetical protein